MLYFLSEKQNKYWPILFWFAKTYHLPRNHHKCLWARLPTSRLSYGPVSSTYIIHLIHQYTRCTILHRPLQYSYPVHCELYDHRMMYGNQKQIHSPHPPPPFTLGTYPSPPGVLQGTLLGLVHSITLANINPVKWPVIMEKAISKLTGARQKTQTQLHKESNGNCDTEIITWLVWLPLWW